MNPARLSQRIVFQQRSIGQDTTGAELAIWTPLLTSWAAIRALTGHELFTAQAVNSEVTHEISVRYQKSLGVPKQVAAMRIAYQGRIFNIHASINVGERNEEIKLHCSEGLNDG